jgi:hypothetical protein
VESHRRLQEQRSALQSNVSKKGRKEGSKHKSEIKEMLKILDAIKTAEKDQ